MRIELFRNHSVLVTTNPMKRLNDFHARWFHRRMTIDPISVASNP
jgi:hypothetical protein